MAAAIAGAAVAAEPTGLVWVDRAWCAAFVATLAWAGGRAARVPLLLAAAAAVLLAGDGLALGIALAAVLVAATNAASNRSRARLATAVAGLVGASLVSGGGSGDAARDAAAGVVVVACVVAAGLAGMRRSERHRAARWLVIVGGLMVVVTVVGALGLLTARRDVDSGVDAFRRAARAARSGDLDAAEREFALADAALRDAQRPLDTFGGALRLVPLAAQQVDAVDSAVDAARDAAVVARRTAAAVDIDRLALTGGAVDMEALVGLQQPASTLEATLDDSVTRLQGLDRRYLVAPVSEALDDALGEARDALVTAGRVRRGIEVAPGLLGSQRPHRYLVLFTTPVEARNRFGFPGAWAVLRFESGRLSYEDAGPIDEITPAGGFDPEALRVGPGVRPYLAYGPTQDWRSVTVPMQFAAVGDLARQLARQSPVGDVDGVVVAGPEALASIVGLVGDVRLDSVGITLTQANTVDFVTRRQYLEFPELGRQRERKDLLADVADVVGKRLEALDLDGLGRLVDVVSPLLSNDALALWVAPEVDADAAALIADTGADAAVPAATDIVHVGQLNGAGNKIDLFVRRKVSYDVRIERDGAVRAELTVELHNQAPPDGLPAYLGGSATQPPLPEGTNRAILLVYGGFPDAEVRVDGRRVPAVAGYDQGRFVRQLALDLSPGERRTVTVVQHGKLSPGEQYRLVALPNGLPVPDVLDVRLVDQRDGFRLRDRVSVGRPLRWPG